MHRAQCQGVGVFGAINSQTLITSLETAEVRELFAFYFLYDENDDLS